MRALIFAAAAVAFAACEKDPLTAEKFDPVSRAEAEEFATAFAHAMVPCSAARLDPLFDFATLLRRSVAKADLSDELRHEIFKATRDQSVGALLCRSIAADATYTLLHIRDVDGQPRPVFRLLGADAVNYHELELGKSRKDHKVRVLDMHVYISGELLSETLAHIYEQGAATMKAGGNMERAGNTLRDINTARAGGDNAEARRLIATLPPRIRGAKGVRLIEVTVSADLPPDEYKAVIERYQHDFPGDPSVEMVSLDHYYLSHDREGALASLDRIDRMVGGDPYTDLLRANANLLDPTPEHLAAADKQAHAAAAALPDNKNVQVGLASVLILEGDRAQVAPILDLLRTKWQLELTRDSRPEQAWRDFFDGADGSGR